MGTLPDMEAPGPTEPLDGRVARSVAERLDLGRGAWVDVARHWLSEPAEVFDALAAGVAWRQARLFRYERYVDEPRLTAWWSVGDPAPHPAVVAAHRALQRTYRVRFDGCSFAWYRDGRDSVAFHRDRDLRWLDDTVIALLTLGTTRPFWIRPRANRNAHALDNHGATHDLSPAAGDLMVMGGSTQTAWEHSVPKVAERIDGRISIQWRWTSRRGRPEQGGSFRDPLHFSR